MVIVWVLEEINTKSFNNVKNRSFLYVKFILMIYIYIFVGVYNEIHKALQSVEIKLIKA